MKRDTFVVTGILALVTFLLSVSSVSSEPSFYQDRRTTLRVVYEVALQLHGDVQFAEFVRALCFSESGGAHFDKNGMVKKGKNTRDSVDVGLFQINNLAHPKFRFAEDPERNLFYGINFAWGKWIEEGKDPLRAAWAYKGKTATKYEYAKRVVNYMKNPPKGVW